MRGWLAVAPLVLAGLLQSYYFGGGPAADGARGMAAAHAQFAAQTTFAAHTQFAAQTTVAAQANDPSPAEPPAHPQGRGLPAAPDPAIRPPGGPPLPSQNATGTDVRVPPVKRSIPPTPPPRAGTKPSAGTKPRAGPKPKAQANSAAQAKTKPKSAVKP